MNWQKHLSIRRILALVSLLFLLLPIGGLYFLRIYESALLRQTESELISQGAFVAAIYKHEVQTLLSQGDALEQRYGLPLTIQPKKQELTPIFPQLDFAKDGIHAARPMPYYTRDKLDPIANAAGRRITPVLQDAQRTTLSGIKVLDYQGLVIAGEKEKGLSFSHAEEFHLAKAGQPVSLLRVRHTSEPSAALNSIRRNANINVYVALPITLHDRLIGIVWLNRTPMDLPQALYGKRRELFWTVFFLVVITILIARLTSSTITRPIRALVQKTRFITEGDARGQEPLKHPITREVSELSENIATMATTIQHRNDYIQNFTAHISHEFKTPLTAIQGSVELLQDHLDDMPKAQQKHFLGNIAQDTARLDRLVSRLIELTRADIADFQKGCFDLRPLLEHVVEAHQSECFKITLVLPDETGPLYISVSLDSLQAVFAHLLENSKQAGATQVEISVDLQASTLALNILDNGPGITETNQEDIFTPFFTTKRDKGGTGMGLSIARALLERQKGHLTLASKGPGACFRLILPSA